LVGIDYSRFIGGLVALERVQYSKFAQKICVVHEICVFEGSGKRVNGGHVLRVKLVTGGSPSHRTPPRGPQRGSLLLRQWRTYNPNPLRRIGVVG
jgi:hypothetical protein